MRKKQNGCGWKDSEVSYTLDRLATQGVLVSPRLTSMHPPSCDTDSPTSKTMAPSRTSTGQPFPILICSSAEVLAKISPSLESEQGSLGLGADLPTSTSVRSKKSVPLTSSGRMSKVFSQATEDGTLPLFSIKWPKRGILSGGKFSTPKISVSLKTANASLSSVLETEVPEKYFLSQETQEKIMEKVRAIPQKRADQK